jgi:hypothetical protein
MPTAGFTGEIGYMQWPGAVRTASGPGLGGKLVVDPG